MSEAQDQSGLFRQVIVVAVPGLGVGAQPDATAGQGANTLANVAHYVGGLSLELLQWMGAGNLLTVRGVEPTNPPAASYARLARQAEGADADGALVELTAGVAGALVDTGRGVHLVGAADALSAITEGATTHAVPDQADFVDVAGKVMHEEGCDLLIACPRGGAPRGGPVAISRALTRLDQALTRFIDQQPDDTLLLVTGLGGHDATVGSGPTREYAPFLAYTPALPSGIDLGTRDTLADVGATIAEVFGLSKTGEGQSFLGQLIA